MNNLLIQFLLVVLISGLFGVSNQAVAESHAYPDSAYDCSDRPEANYCNKKGCRDPYRDIRRFHRFMMFFGLNGQFFMILGMNYGMNPWGSAMGGMSPYSSGYDMGGSSPLLSGLSSPYYGGLFGRSYGPGLMAY